MKKKRDPLDFDQKTRDEIGELTELSYEFREPKGRKKGERDG